MGQPQEIIDHGIAGGIGRACGGRCRRRGSGLRGCGIRHGGRLGRNDRFRRWRGGRSEQIEKLGTAEGFFGADGLDDFADGIADRQFLEVEVARTRGGNEGRAVAAFVEAKSGAAERAAQALGETQRKTFFLGAGVIKQRRQRGIDGGRFRIARHGSDVDKFEMRRGIMLGEMALDRGQVGELFRILPFARIIHRRP